MASYMFSELYARNGNAIDERVFCVYLGLDETMALYWRLAALMLSILGGLVVGFGSRDAQLGLDVGTAILAILLVFHGTLRIQATLSKRCSYYGE